VQFKANRVLFVAHRDEILRQALATFRAIRQPRPLHRGREGSGIGRSLRLDSDPR
jgi:hypothetical protein